MNASTLKALFERYGVVGVVRRGIGDQTVTDFLHELEVDGAPLLAIDGASLETLEPAMMGPLPGAMIPRETVLDVVVDQGVALRDSLERVRLELLEHRQDVEAVGLTVAAAILYAAQALEERDPQTAIENVVALRQELNREMIRRDVAARNRDAMRREGGQ